uniref:Nucleolar protein 16 n=1 Tax=Panagrolaimus davidi TaxID=227884 RepID=A0A914PH32_9BILA
MLKNAAGYEPAQVDEDITILDTVGTFSNGGVATTSTSTNTMPKRLNVEDLRKLLPPSSLFKGNKRNKYRQLELPWVAKVFVNLRKKYKKPTGKYIKKIWADFEDDLKNLGRTKQSFLNYYTSGTGRRDLKIVVDQIKMGYDPSICGPAKLKKSDSSDSDSDSD